ncbi:MAG: hypothetical protein ABFC12_01740 [Methanobacterium sp.]
MVIEAAKFLMIELVDYALAVTFKYFDRELDIVETLPFELTLVHLATVT